MKDSILCIIWNWLENGKYRESTQLLPLPHPVLEPGLCQTYMPHSALQSSACHSPAYGGRPQNTGFLFKVLCLHHPAPGLAQRGTRKLFMTQTR